MASYQELRAQADAEWREFTRADRIRVLVGVGSCGIASGSENTLSAIRDEVKRRGLDALAAGTSCLGLCDDEPVVEIARPGQPSVVYGGVTAGKAAKLLEDVLVNGDPRADMAIGNRSTDTWRSIPALESIGFFHGQERRIMYFAGQNDPESVDHYIANGGYEGLVRCLTQMKPPDVIQEVLASGLGGRGGANFPAGRKWQFMADAKGSPKYMICNADEGDPGAFVNRELLEGNPHSVIEGMLIGCYAAAGAAGYIYIREEYPLAARIMKQAIEQARARGLVGERILGTDFSCEMKVVVGAGSYVCGEETGLISSIQDSRGMPRIRPPYPAQAGLFYRPSTVNNVETFAHVPFIMRNGADWFKEKGTQRHAGTKMFSLSGDIVHTSISEVPLGMPLRHLVEVIGGGVPEGRALKAIQPGGPLAGIMPASLLDTPLEAPAFAEHGVALGGGGIVVLDERVCMVDMSYYFTDFCQEESCGRCTTCRIGSMRMADIIRRIQMGGGKDGDIENLEYLIPTMANGNCFHGQATPIAFQTTLRYFRQEWEEHVYQKRCAAKVCSGLIQYRIEGSDASPFASDCPTGAIVQTSGSWQIDQRLCIKCGICREKAPEMVVVRDAYPRPLPAAMAAS